MIASKLSRRNALARAGLLLGAAAVADPQPRAQAQTQNSPAPRPFRFCLNTATIRGQKVGIVREVDIAAQAGYDAIEPWISSLEEYANHGGSLKDLAKRISDAGLTVEGGIAFAEWLTDDDARRARGLERAKRDMDLAAQIGARRIAAPPAGATDLPKLDFNRAVERYRALLELGDTVGLTPEFELWGPSKNFSRLGECVALAMETGHPRACVLADVFHLYKGGSDYRGLRLLGPDAVQVLHMNDYPSEPPREKINDGYRVLPGDGAAPLVDILRALRRSGGEKVLSLEIFNAKYWAEDALEVAKTGLAKMKAVAAQAAA